MRFIGKFIVSLLAIVGLIAVIIVGILWFAFSEFRDFAGREQELPEATVLALSLDQPFSEGEQPLGIGVFGQDTMPLRRVLETLAQAAADPRVKAVVARMSSSNRGVAQTQELRRAIMAFRESGKPALLFADTLGEGTAATRDYYLASAFDETWLQPSGMLSFTGFAIEVPFAREALESIGVGVEHGRRWEYKNALDSVVRDEMSAPHRASLQRMLTSWQAQVVADVAQARKLPPEAVADLMMRPPLFASEARDAGLIDRIGYWDEVLASVEQRTGVEVDDWMEFPNYANRAPDPTPAGAVKMALIHGVGTVQQGESRFGDLTAEAVFGADTVAAAIRDAVEDPEIRGIILRIDSPGGSYVAADAVWREVHKAREMRIPIIASFGDMAASGGYFAGMAADKVVAEPGTITGSIGVFAAKPVLSGTWDKLNVNWDAVAVGRHALMWSLNQPFQPEEEEWFGRMLDTIYADFTGKVREARSMSEQQIDQVARGRIWTGADALEVGLVDALGGLGTAVGLALSEAGLAEDTAVELVPFPERKEGLAALLEMLERNDFPGILTTLARLHELAAPVVREAEHLSVATEGPAVMTYPIRLR